MEDLSKNLYDSLCRVLKNFKSRNFIQMNGFGPEYGVTSDDLKAFNDYFELEPYRFVYGDWDILKFKKNNKDLDIKDYAEMQEQIDSQIDELEQKSVTRTEKQKIELKYEDYGWLSPNGEFYASEWGTHQTRAAEIVDKLDLYRDYLKTEESEPRLTQADYLSKYKNFILIHSPSQGIPYPTILQGKRLTRKQKEFLYDFYMERNYASLAYKYFNE